MSPALLALVVALAQQPAGAADPAIADNSFLIEEAYNQEAGVVQHINLYTRQWQTGAWVYAFTQEWPTPGHARQQWSYTLAGLNGGQGKGLGDVGISWRYQMRADGRFALAPRVGVTIPSGRVDKSRGSGRAGFEVNIPLSTRFEHIVSHTNIGGGRLLGTSSDGTASAVVRVGQGLVLLPNRRVNVLLEALATRESITGTNARVVTTFSPGVRWAHDLGSVQIVPGIAVPVDVTRDEGASWRVLGYLSVEHPFGGRR